MNRVCYHVWEINYELSSQTIKIICQHWIHLDSITSNHDIDSMATKHGFEVYFRIVR